MPGALMHKYVQDDTHRDMGLNVQILICVWQQKIYICMYLKMMVYLHPYRYVYIYYMYTLVVRFPMNAIWISTAVHNLSLFKDQFLSNHV